jgi:hypothetical protein
LRLLTKYDNDQCSSNHSGVQQGQLLENKQCIRKWYITKVISAALPSQQPSQSLTKKPTSTESEFSSEIKDNIISQRDIMNRANSYAKNPYTFSCFDASKHSSKQSTFSANRTRLIVLKTKKNPAQMIKD